MSILSVMLSGSEESSRCFPHVALRVTGRGTRERVPRTAVQDDENGAQNEGVLVAYGPQPKNVLTLNSGSGSMPSLWMD